MRDCVMMSVSASAPRWLYLYLSLRHSSAIGRDRTVRSSSSRRDRRSNRQERRPVSFSFCFGCGSKIMRSLDFGDSFT